MNKMRKLYILLTLSINNMKKKLVFALILFSIVIISGCGKGAEEATGSAVESVCKSPYFEFKVGECCLDQNANSICDSDEKPAEEVVIAEEVEITLEDSCTDTTYFECVASYITKDELFLKFETRREGFVHLKSVSSMGCKKDFADKNKAMVRHQEQLEASLKKFFNFYGN